MMLHRLGLFHRNQAGLTVLEIIATFFVTGLVGVGAAIANVQVLNQTSENTDYTIVGKPAEMLYRKLFGGRGEGGAGGR